MDICGALLGYSAQCQNQNQNQYQGQDQDCWSSQSWSSDNSMSSPEAASPTSPAGCLFSSPCSPSGSRPGIRCACLGGRCVRASPCRVRRIRTKNPSRQRRNASEKEKLRMRDLTKALHHLGTYLPPSLAPAGQTLTKIQILRLAIRHIAHLSAQLEPAKGAATGGADTQNSPEIQGHVHCAPVSEFWRYDQSRVHELHIGRREAPFTPQRPLQPAGPECGLFSCALEVYPQDSLFSSSLIPAVSRIHRGNAVMPDIQERHLPSIPEDFWI